MATYEEEKKDDGDLSANVAIPKMHTREDTSSKSFSNTSTQNRNDQRLKKAEKKIDATSKRLPFPLRMVGRLLRSCLVEIPILSLFAFLVAVTVLRQVHDKYIAKQIELMVFQGNQRDYFESTYYHRFCHMDDDVSATSTLELMLPKNATGEECVEHQMTHGVSVYPDLLSPETMHELREFIVEENKKQDGFYVIENDFRFSWGIDVNMHPSIKKYWKELASNKLLVDGIQAIVGPDPAIIEFTAITSAYGAKDQFDHQDVVPPGNGVKYAHSYLPSYSLFIPLQDTSYDMGATHVCPGSHLCSAGASANCKRHNLAMSGEDDNWPAGYGALVNQQTTHKGMGHSKKGGLDRVVIICTFTPRPQTFRGLETRIIGQGGSYSIDWASWGHTFSDFAFAETRMWEPLKTMRAIGLVKGNGWNLIHTASMRIANDDNGYNNKRTIKKFLKDGGFKVIPIEWHGELTSDEEEWLKTNYVADVDNDWYYFLVGTLIRTEARLRKLYKNCLPASIVFMLILDLGICFWNQHSNIPSLLLRSTLWLIFLHIIIASIGFGAIYYVEESSWAKDIASEKAYQLPFIDGDVDANGVHVTQAVMPTESDILIAPEYDVDHLAGYGRVIDFAHPGNVVWNSLRKAYGEGYALLDYSLQREFCEFLLDYVRQDARFLHQGDEREWLEVENRDSLFDICHHDMMTAADKRILLMSRQINSLRSISKLGRFSQTVMHRKLSPEYLDTWEALLIPRRQWASETRSLLFKGRPIHHFRQQTKDSISSKHDQSSSRHTIPKPHDPKEPFSLAWLREGDIIEAMFNCDSNAYYRATVAAIVACDGTIDVKFDDGDFNDGLRLHCLRPFKPYELNEHVQMRQLVDSFSADEDGIWLDGTIVKIYENNEETEEVTFDIRTSEDNLVFAEIGSSDIRRFETQKFSRGDRVSALYKDDDEWFPGKIMQVNADGTYYVIYADGDMDPRVPASKIRKQAQRE